MAVQTDDLEAVVAGFPAGRWDAAERVAFQEAYERYHDRIYRFCRFRLGDSYEAEDVTQETFARAWKAGGVLFEEQRLYPWLRVVAANLCTDLLRRRKRCQPDAEVDPGTVDQTEAQVIGAGDAEMLRLAMTRLNERHRMALEQRESAGWTYEQMAAHSGTTIASIESLLWRARQALKREFTAIAGPDGLLSGVPVIGLLLRKLHRARLRMAGWMARSGRVPELAGGNAVVASVLGSATAACLATFGSLLGPAAAGAALGSVPAAVYASGASAGSGAARAAPSTAAAATTEAASAVTTSRSGGNHPVRSLLAAQGLNRPVDVVHSQQREQALPDQVSISSVGGTDGVSVSPDNTVGWAERFVAHRLTQSPGATTP